MRIVFSKRRRLAGLLAAGLFTSIASLGHAEEGNVAPAPFPPLPSSSPYSLTGNGSSVERVMQVAHAQPTPEGTLPPVVVEPPTTQPTTPLPGVTPTDSFPGNDGPVNPGPNLAPGELYGYIPLRDQVMSTGGSIMPGATSATRGLDMSIFDSPNDITIIGPQLLEERQSSDMARTLQNEVGVLVQSAARGQASPFIRGLTGQQVVILIDGVRLNNSTFRAGPNQYFSTIDPGMVERIEVVRGAQSVLWGSDAIGGVINVVTKSPDRYSGSYGDAGFKEIFSTADLASYTRMSVETWTGDRGIYGGASYMNVNDLDIGGGRGRQPFTDYDQYAGDFKVQQLLDADNILTLSMQHFEQQDVPRSDRFAPFTSSPRPTFFDVQQRDMLNLRLDGLTNNVFYDGYSLTFNYSRQKEGVNERRLNANGTTNRFELGEFDVNTFGTVLTLVKDFEQAGKLSYGADFYYDDVDAVRTRTINNSNPVPPANQNVTPQFPNDSTYDRVGVYAMWEIPLTERLTVMPGIRYESANAEGTTPINNVPTFVDRSYDDWVASVGLNYKLTDDCALVGGYYEGYRAPNLDDLFADVSFAQGQFQTISSINVGPEYSQTYEVGLKVDTDDFRMQVFQYWNNLENAILRYPVNAQGQFAPNGTNVIRDNSDSYIYGTELGGEYMLDSWGYCGWSLYGNVWYTYGVDLGTNEVGAPSEPFSRIPPLTGTLGTRWRSAYTKQWLDIFVFAAGRADRYSLLNSQDARFIPGGTPGYATLNARTGRRWGKNDCHEFAVGLENITDTYYRVLGSGVDGAGINAIFSYGYTY